MIAIAEVATAISAGLMAVGSGLAVSLLGFEKALRAADSARRPARTVVWGAARLSAFILRPDERAIRREEWRALITVLNERDKLGLVQAVGFVWASVKTRVVTFRDPTMPAVAPAGAALLSEGQGGGSLAHLRVDLGNDKWETITIPVEDYDIGPDELTGILQRALEDYGLEQLTQVVIELRHQDRR